MQDKLEIIAKVEGIENLILEKMSALEEVFGVKLENILVQTTKTNGRVTHLETKTYDYENCKQDIGDIKTDMKKLADWKNFMAGGLAVLSILTIGIIIPLVRNYIEK